MSILKSEPAVTWTVLLWVLNSSMLDWGSSELAASLIDFSVTFLINTFFMVLQNSGKDPPLPLVDSHAQHLIQKRIAVEKLSQRSVFSNGWISVCHFRHH